MPMEVKLLGRVIADRRYTVRYDEFASEAIAIIESVITNGFKLRIFFKREACEFYTTMESIISDRCHAVRYDEFAG